MLRFATLATMLAMAFAVSPMLARPASAMTSICTKSCDACPESHGQMTSDCAMCCVVGTEAPDAPTPILPMIGTPTAVLLLPLTSRSVRPVAPPPR